ncbi:sugar transferase [Aureimonas sp. Leaf324]|jgi:lipopolysaccharide/colanic/teichoic acid biosynthesis glycosyltransferase|uniref:sugar transferase n=1 Tax=Aureimonas sp. Leaf324 TaxID=1736336 RepID=UPI0009EA53B3|nr:sugar transferase [Aureimonas sp. Leaf324]
MSGIETGGRTGEAAVGTPVPWRAALIRALAAVLLLLSLPFWLLAAGIVYASIGRPLLFRQTRSGLGARPFTICKFRTMRDTRGPDGTLLPDAFRQTRATQLLRAWRLDELPQLLAIVRGDMTLVGPRPLLPGTIAAFGDWGIARCAVLPGLTGWAQVNGNTRLSDCEKLTLDLWYVRHRSLVLDLRILFMTVLVLIRGERRMLATIASAAAELAPSDAAGGAAS